MKKTIFPISTTTVPPTMDDNVAFLIERPGHEPEVLIRTHREICASMDHWRGAELDPPTKYEHYLGYLDVLEGIYPGLDVTETECWMTRHELAFAVKCYSESVDWLDKRKAEVLRDAIEKLPAYRELPALERFRKRNHRLIEKWHPAQRHHYRLEQYDPVCSDNLTDIKKHLKKQAGVALRAKTVNRCNITRGSVFSLQLIQCRLSQGKKRYVLYFVDEKVGVELDEQDARLVHRFFNDTTDDVLDCLEIERVQQVLREAESEAIEQHYRAGIEQGRR